MYPLTAILIDCESEACPELKHELLEQGVKVGAQFPDIGRTIAELQVTSLARRLFVIHLTSIDDCRQLERLNDVFAGEPIVALAPDPSEALLLQAMRAGAAQVVALPLRSDDFKEALERIARQFGYPANASRVIAVTGVSEGCGATTIAINLAAEAAAEHRLPTLLAEMSLHMGRLAGHLDLTPGYTTYDLLTDIDRLDIEIVQQALVKAADNLQVLAGPYRGIPNLKPTPDQVARLVDYTRRLARVVVLDMPYTYDDVYFRTLKTADHVVLVAEPNIPSLEALKTLHKTLEEAEGIKKPFVVLNRYNPRCREFGPAQVAELLRLPRIFTVREDASHCTDALNNGHTLRQETTESLALAGIDDLVDALLGQRRPHPPRHWHLPDFLRRLVAAGRSK